MLNQPPSNPFGRTGWRRLFRSRSFHSTVLALALASILLGWINALGGTDALQARFGWVAALFIVPAHLIISVVPIGEFVPWGAANGMLFGIGVGALLNWCAWMGAAIVQYGFGRQVAHDFDVEDRMQRLPAWVQRFPFDHPVMLICARWFPMGATLVNMGAGVRRLPIGRLLWCAALGCSVQAVAIAAVGAGLASLWSW